MCDDVPQKAVDCLKRLRGSHRLQEKCEALGYQCVAEKDETLVMEGNVPVAKILDDEVTLIPDRPQETLDREITDDQWRQFEVLDRWRVAIHEAGHAVAAFRLELGVGLVYIDGCNRGETSLAESDEFADPDEEDNHERNTCTTWRSTWPLHWNRLGRPEA